MILLSLSINCTPTPFVNAETRLFLDEPSTIHISFYAYTEDDEAVCREALATVTGERGK